jgi:hypothetical protein
MAQVTVSGTVKDTNHSIPTSGTLTFTLSDYMIESGGTIIPAKAESCNISAVDGSFSVILGSTLDATPSTRTYSVAISAVIEGTTVSQSLGTIQLAASPSSVVLSDLIISGLSGGTAVTPTLSAADVSLTLRETDQALPLGLWRIRVNGDVLTFEKNTAVAGDFGTLSTFLSLSAAGIWTFTKTAVGVTSTDGMVLQNNTAAAAGAQQYSPRLRLTGQGWKTTATAASQEVDFILEVQPVQGAASPSGNLVISSQINSGGYSGLFYISAGGSAGTQFSFGGSPDANVAYDVKTGTFTVPAGNDGYAEYHLSTVNAAVGNNAFGVQLNPQLQIAGSGTHTAFIGLQVQTNALAGAGNLTNLIGVRVMSMTAPANTTNAFGLMVVAPTSASSINNAARFLKSDGSTVIMDIMGSGSVAIAQAGPHVIGGSTTPGAQLFLTGSWTPASGAPSSLAIGSTLNPAAGADSYAISLAPTFAKASSGTHPSFVGIRTALAFSAGASSLTDAIGIDVVTFAATASTTNATGLRVAAPTGATNNYAIDVLSGDVVLAGSGARLATNATAGFTFIPTCQGTPTGTPATTLTGTAPLIFDETAHKLWAYDRGASAWKGVVLS